MVLAIFKAFTLDMQWLVVKYHFFRNLVFSSKLRCGKSVGEWTVKLNISILDIRSITNTTSAFQGVIFTQPTDIGYDDIEQSIPWKGGRWRPSMKNVPVLNKKRVIILLFFTI